MTSFVKYDHESVFNGKNCAHSILKRKTIYCHRNVMICMTFKSSLKNNISEAMAICDSRPVSKADECHGADRRRLRNSASLPFAHFPESKPSERTLVFVFLYFFFLIDFWLGKVVLCVETTLKKDVGSLLSTLVVFYKSVTLEHAAVLWRPPTHRHRHGLRTKFTIPKSPT